MGKHLTNTTKLQIVRVALKMFMKKGFTATTAKMICDKLDISPGNLTYYFPTKEHILAVLVEMLCDFQWNVIEKETDEGISSLLSYCLELTAMAAMCEESQIAKDFYLSAYTHPMTLSIIRDNDAEKAKRIFGEWCKDWDEVNYREAEMLVSGIEYATMIPTERSAPLNVRIAGALNAIMTIYNVPKELIARKVQRVTQMDYLSIGRKVLEEFSKYVDRVTEHAIEEKKSARKNLKVVPKEKTHKAKKLPRELDCRKSSGQNEATTKKGDNYNEKTENKKKS